MTIIDCHAHAFPTIEEMYEILPEQVLNAVSDSLPEAAEDLARGLLSKLPLKFAGKVAQKVANHLPVGSAQMPYGPQRLAEVRKKIPQGLANSFEFLSSPGVSPQILVNGTLTRLLRSMDRNGISKTVVIGSAPFALNSWLIEATRLVAPERFIPVAHLPELHADRTDETTWLAAYEDLAQQGYRGFKIHPNMDGLDSQHIAWRALFEVARKHDLFVIIHTGCFNVPGYKHHNPSEPGAFRTLFEEFTDVRVCLAHMNRDHPERAWEVMQQYDHVYADTSWQPSEHIRTALKTVGVDRIVLGSDWPLLNDALQDDSVESLRGGSSNEEFKEITHQNALRLFGETS